jgi:hypothetical protein
MVTKKIAPHHQRAVKLAGHHAKRVATTARYRHADRTGTADAAPWLVATQRDRGSTADRIDIANDERGGLSNLSTPELIDVVASELAARPEMHLVRNHVTALLAMAPTLTDRTQANRIGADVVDDAVEQAELETRARRHILDYPMLTAGQVAAVLRRPESDRTVASRLRTAGKVGQVAPESVGLDSIGTGGKVRAVDVFEHVGAGVVEDLIAPLESEEII